MRLAAHIDPLRWAIGGPGQPVEEPDGRAAVTQRRTVINPGLARLLNFLLFCLSAVSPLRLHCGGGVQDLGAALCLFGFALFTESGWLLRGPLARVPEEPASTTPSHQDAIPEFISIL